MPDAEGEVHLGFCSKPKPPGPTPQGRWPQASRPQSWRAGAKEFFLAGTPGDITALGSNLINLFLERREIFRAGDSIRGEQLPLLSLSVLLPRGERSSASPPWRPLPLGVSLWACPRGPLSAQGLRRLCARHFHTEHQTNPPENIVT